MNATGGLGVIIENRYYGQSVPFENLTTDNLAYLTNEQTIADFAYFAQHATFPGVNVSLTAPATPWILYGGSLAGAQTSFTVKTYPDLVYGGIAASGVIAVKRVSITTLLLRVPSFMFWNILERNTLAFVAGLTSCLGLPRMVRSDPEVWPKRLCPEHQ